MGQIKSNLRLKMKFCALGRLKNHNVPYLHPNSTMFMPLDMLQLKIYAFSGKFNVCSKHVLLSWIKICRNFTLQTQIFTQKYRSWLRFYSEFLRKKLAAGGSACDCDYEMQTFLIGRIDCSHCNFDFSHHNCCTNITRTLKWPFCINFMLKMSC